MTQKISNFFCFFPKFGDLFSERKGILRQIIPFFYLSFSLILAKFRAKENARSGRPYRPCITPARRRRWRCVRCLKIATKAFSSFHVSQPAKIIITSKSLFLSRSATWSLWLLVIDFVVLFRSISSNNRSSWSWAPQLLSSTIRLLNITKNFQIRNFDPRFSDGEPQICPKFGNCCEADEEKERGVPWECCTKRCDWAEERWAVSNSLLWHRRTGEPDSHAGNCRAESTHGNCVFLRASICHYECEGSRRGFKFRSRVSASSLLSETRSREVRMGVLDLFSLVSWFRERFLRSASLGHVQRSK